MQFYILLVVIGVGLACECDKSDEDVFCEADFVLKVDVKDEAEVGGNYQYQVDVKTEYRATNEIDEAKKIVQTKKGGDCAKSLSTGSTYFITGNYVQADDGSKVLGISDCDVVGAKDDDRVQAILKADISCSKRSTEEMVLRSLLRRVVENNAPNRLRKAIL